MNQCAYISQEIIQNAFKRVTSNLGTLIISKIDLTEKIAVELHLTTEQLKAQYLTAFLVCYMKDLHWKYDTETETFHKKVLNFVSHAVVRGVTDAGWNKEVIEKVRQIILKDFGGVITSGNVDPEEVSITCKTESTTVKRIIKRSDLS